jgi:hypothetical protein
VGESCRRCGGMGHYARECPTQKGKGKGEAGKGGWKGKGKGKFGGKGGEPSWKGSGWKGGEPGWKGGGKGGWKGKGKGFMGECWTSGERGHRSNECTNQNPKTAMEIGSVEEEQLHVGGVWAIAQVQAQEEEWSVAQSKKNRRKARVNCVKVVGAEESGKKGKVEKSVCAVSGEIPWRPVGSGEITVDSAAEESVCPKAWGEAYQMRRPSKWLRFVNASGGQMGHYGEKTATFRAGGG